MPGITIITDCWRVYLNFSSIVYNHSTVNHSQNFIDTILEPIHKRLKIVGYF
ncbi:hypothetical protein H312_02640 [Anncaliia algerae PRA339]|uniref:ISXO2-like transposase domain-containing protein n=1 Tax=Anncaliia algerae PRA339 TaxID=1288291 RepID=A0A059EYL5_9MICR|nr:hypothetical protein H312_02640 [Anncaliia algerae PRA339]